MRRLMIRFIPCLTMLVVLTPGPAFAQTTNKPEPARADSDQLVQAMLIEFRLLRAELRRMSVNAHRSQVVLQRIRLAQEQVVQLRRDLSDIHDKLDEIRPQQPKMRRYIEIKTKHRDAGLTDDSFVKDLREAAEELDNRERALAHKESLLTAELSTEEANLAALNNRLDEIERDMVQPVPGDDGAPAKRQQ
jgi:hypothetical protein